MAASVAYKRDATPLSTHFFRQLSIIIGDSVTDLIAADKSNHYRRMDYTERQRTSTCEDVTTFGLAIICILLDARQRFRKLNKCDFYTRRCTRRDAVGVNGT